jgi:hypothetical protein
MRNLFVKSASQVVYDKFAASKSKGVLNLR